MFEVKDLLNVFKKHNEYYTQELKKRKNNIHKEYYLAILDIKVIENMEDHKKVCENIEKQLNDLQQRIIKRNRGEL